MSFSSAAAKVLPLLLDCALKGAIILLLATAATLALRRASAALRHLIWSLAVACLLALPILSAALPAWQVERLPRILLSPFAAQAQPPAGEVTRGQLAAVGAGADTLWSTALIVWALGAIAALVPVLLGRLCLRRLRKEAHPISDPAWVEPARRAAANLSLRSPAALFASPQTLLPMVWGWLRPALLLPAGAEEWLFERRRLVLLHELAHVKRADCLTQLLGQLACALYWFNPLVWLAARRLRVEQERACDDLVLNVGFKPSDYAGHLLDIARAARRPAFASSAAIAMARSSGLEARIRALLDAGRSRRGVSRRAALMALLAVVAVALPLAPVRGVEARRESAPTPRPGPKAKAIPAEQQSPLPQDGPQSVKASPSAASAPNPRRSRSLPSGGKRRPPPEVRRSAPQSAASPAAQNTPVAQELGGTAAASAQSPPLLPAIRERQQTVSNQLGQVFPTNQALPQQSTLQSTMTQAQAVNQEATPPQPAPAQQPSPPGSQGPE
jgi:beta-lactamase regulating signal transducer with metallopeptidase domain